MTNPRSTETQSDALNTPENQGSLARTSASEANYREGYLHGRTSESQQEDARNLRGQANAIHTTNVESQLDRNISFHDRELFTVR
ncbi:MAG: hypothetical protein ACFCU9_03920 [Cyanophyceae cyanobacterium]